MAKPADKKKPSSVRHTRAIHRDRTKRPTVGPPDEKIEQLLKEIVQPATYAQLTAYWNMGLRQRILNLPVMVALVLSMIWRQFGAVSELVRTLHKEKILWSPPQNVSQQAVSKRLSKLPHQLFYRVLMEVLPKMHERWGKRQRPLPEAIQRARKHFPSILALDGSTLDALLRKVGLAPEGQERRLAGRMAALLDVVSQLPRQIWYEEDSQAHDQRFWEKAIEVVGAGTLLLFDLGFTNYPLFDRLTDKTVWFVTRAKVNAAYETDRVLQKGKRVCDQIIRLGSRGKECTHLMRLVEVEHQGKWYRYLTNVLDPETLPVGCVVALYWQRWRIEDAFNAVKRLLGLAYFWAGTTNAIQVQVWATWLLYAVLVDLTDTVAERLHVPYRAVSLEMVYRGLYHYTRDHARGQTDDPTEYLALNAKDLGILKRKRRPSPEEILRQTLAQDA